MIEQTIRASEPCPLVGVATPEVIFAQQPGGGDRRAVGEQDSGWIQQQTCR